MVRDNLTKREREERRKQVVEVWERGFSTKEVSEIFNISTGSVRQWRREYKQNGMCALEAISYGGSHFETELTLSERTRIELEARRKEALRALNRELAPQKIGEVLDVTPDTVRYWRSTYVDEGIEGIEADADFGERNYLEHISADYLRDILNKVEGSKATQRVMLGLTYLAEDDVTKAELAERYGVTRNTVREWLLRLEKLGNEPLEKAIYDSSSGHSRALSQEELQKLKNILQKSPKEYDISAKYWSKERVSTVVTQELGVSISPTTATRYLDEISWSKTNTQDADAWREKSNKECLGKTDLESLQSKLSQIVDRPTQRIITAILYKTGLSVSAIADWFNKSEGAIYQWFDWFEDQPLDEAPYRDCWGKSSPKISEEQMLKLEELLIEGAEANGFTGQIWTGKRVANIIEKEFDETVSPHTARRYMKKIGWSRQKPQRRAIERNDTEIKKFINEEWKEIRDDAMQNGEMIVFIDETKFRLLPTFKKTWAPVGETPTVENSGLYEYVAVIGALTYIPETQDLDLHWSKQKYNFETNSVTDFFQEIQELSSNDAILILDNLSAHKSAEAELKEEAEESGITMEWFPEYASDINPVDNVWGHAKYNELSNYAPKDLDELESKVDETLSDIRTDNSVLRYCIKDTGLEIEA